MNILLLLLLVFLFPYHINGLLCVANKTYINLNGQYPDQFLNISVNNTIIKRCKVTITLSGYDKEIRIKYYGEDIIHEISDFINLEILFASAMQLVGIDRMLTFVCSWEDFCEQKYIETWSQWLFNISFIDIQNDIDQYFKNINDKDYSTTICYDTDQPKTCSNHVCFSSNNKNGIINKCAELNDMPYDIQLIANNQMILPIAELIHLTIETKVLMEDIDLKHNYQLNHNISYFCTFKQCNDPLMATELGDKIKAKYHLEDMLNFVSSIPEGTFGKSQSTTTTDSTSTEKTNNGNQCYSISFIAFVLLFFIAY